MSATPEWARMEAIGPDYETFATVKIPGPGSTLQAGDQLGASYIGGEVSYYWRRPRRPWWRRLLRLGPIEPPWQRIAEDDPRCALAPSVRVQMDEQRGEGQRGEWGE